MDGNPSYINPRSIKDSSKMKKRRLLAVFAHPDDETLRAEGTLALLAKRGVQVQMLTAIRDQGRQHVFLVKNTLSWPNPEKVMKALTY